MILMLSSAVTAIIICFTGIIGFVCLVAPHISRLLIGNDHRFLIPLSGLMGALLLLTADTVGRTIVSPVEIPVGIVTSFVGVPLFLWLLIRKRTKNF
jgi:iron complex transport system permease protein